MYWSNRDEINVSFFNRLLQNDFFLWLSGLFYPFRKGNEYFIRKILKKTKPQSVLDIACGAGKAVIPASCPQTIGVDIEGYPKEHAKTIGYKELYTYMPPEYNIELNNRVDAVTMINLNAHISFQNFITILKNALKCLKPGGQVIFIFEFDNDCFEYKIMKRNPEKFKKMISNMQHDFFEYEDKFINKLEKEFTELTQNKRSAIHTVLPLLHFFAYQKSFKSNVNYFEKKPNIIFRITSLIIELPMGLLDNLLRLFSARKNKSFIVGYHYTYSPAVR